jgi:hypothetical protein
MVVRAGRERRPHLRLFREARDMFRRRPRGRRAVYRTRSRVLGEVSRINVYRRRLAS